MFPARQPGPASRGLALILVRTSVRPQVKRMDLSGHVGGLYPGVELPLPVKVENRSGRTPAVAEARSGSLSGRIAAWTMPARPRTNRHASRGQALLACFVGDRGTVGSVSPSSPGAP